MAPRKTVLVLPPSVLHPAAMQLLHTEVDVVVGLNLEPVHRMEALARCHGLIGGGTAEHVADARCLEVIGIPGSGSEHIAVAAATAAGVAVVNAAGGRALVLCTSHANVRRFADLLRERTDHDILAQGDADVGRVALAEPVAGGGDREVQVGAGVAVGHGVDVDRVDLV